jgi:Flp pilus assembly secretin CpaC
MANVGQKISRSQWLFLVVAVGVVLWIGGYCQLFGQSDTEENAVKALTDLQIDLSIPEPNIPIPEIYKTPPKVVEQVVGGLPEFKLFYFCKHHTSDELKKIVHEQFATKLFDKKGNQTKLVDYTVSSSSATNQLIVRCPAREDIDAVLELLEAVDVPPIQVKIDCLISEIYADFTFDRETTIEILNLFGESITLKPGGQAFGESILDLVDEGGEILPAFPGASLRELIRSRMGLKIGYLSGARNFAVLVDLLESRGYLKILMNPVLETTNGKTAVVKATQHVPLQKVTKYIPVESEYLPQTETEYVDVIDSLEVTPHVFSDGSIALETTIHLEAKNTPDGVKQVPILTKKEIANKENRVRPGESLIIGGMRKNEKFGVIRGVPLLKDIPLLGFLFSGEDTEQRAVETVFILTPTYSTGGRPRREVMEEIAKKHESVQAESLQETLIGDIFGDKGAEEEQLQKIHETEQSLHEAQAEREEARSAARQASAKIERITTKAQKATTEAAKTKADAEQLMAEAQKLIARAEAQSKAAGQAKTAADKAIADAKKAQEQAKKAKAQADEKSKAAEKAIKDAEAEKAKAVEKQSKANPPKSEEEPDNSKTNKPKEEIQAKAESKESGENNEKVKTEENSGEPEA